VNDYAHSIYLRTPPGVPTKLSRVGSSLENPFVYDSVARDLKRLALEGLVEIIDEKTSGDGGEPLIERIAFLRLR
jgi:hypothetical protein